jgi:hypothetical protein
VECEREDDEHRSDHTSELRVVVPGIRAPDRSVRSGRSQRLDSELAAEFDHL